MINIITVAPDWGHLLLTPDGNEIRVPKSAFESLRKLGVLERNRAQLKPIIYSLLDRKYDDLLMGLRQLLGRDLEGPAWCECHCRDCQRKESITDNTRLPGHKNPGINTDRIVQEIKARRRAA
jgi:hypothetical protein